MVTPVGLFKSAGLTKSPPGIAWSYVAFSSAMVMPA
jgi:hypothetical protein